MPTSIAGVLTMLLLLAFAIWIAGRWSSRPARIVATVVVLLALALGTGRSSITRPPPGEQDLVWEAYSTARLDELVARGTPVFVDFTATWCVTCQVNERLTLAAPAVMARMRGLGVVPMRADWTSSDPEITRALQGLGRDGVPLYVLYSGKLGDPPRVLPQLLTREIVIGELDELETRSRT